VPARRATWQYRRVSAPLNDAAIWRDPPPGRVVGRGHPVGDFLHAYDWELVELRPDYLKVSCDLPPQVKNFRGELFGGFSPTYVDLLSLRCVSASRPPGEPRGRLVTVNMRLDYFEPVVGPRFFVECEIRNRRGRMHLVETRFRDTEGTLLVFAITTIRTTELPRHPGPEVPTNLGPEVPTNLGPEVPTDLGPEVPTDLG
jgi:acyl-coenzyme A thioesterase PaaI-like protein